MALKSGFLKCTAWNIVIIVVYNVAYSNVNKIKNTLAALQTERNFDKFPKKLSPFHWAASFQKNIIK